MDSMLIAETNYESVYATQFEMRLVCVYSGATFVLEQSKMTLTFSPESIDHTYTQAHIF